MKFSYLNTVVQPFVAFTWSQTEFNVKPKEERKEGREEGEGREKQGEGKREGGGGKEVVSSIWFTEEKEGSYPKVYWKVIFK